MRPLKVLEEKSGAFITRGIEADALDIEKKWEFKPLVKSGDKVVAGDILGEVQETSLIVHKVMVPPHIKEGTVEDIKSGEFSVNDTIAKIGDENITMAQKWPIRDPRPVKEKLNPNIPLITGQRIIDTFSQ